MKKYFIVLLFSFFLLKNSFGQNHFSKADSVQIITGGSVGDFGNINGGIISKKDSLKIDTTRVTFYIDGIKVKCSNLPICDAVFEYRIDDFASTHKQFFIFESSLNEGSNAINNYFALRFYFKSGFNEADKQTVIPHLKAMNRIGFDFTNGITYNGKKYYYGIYNHNTFNTQFAKDAFLLLFEGNAPYAGNTLDLSKTKFFNLNYNQFKIGFDKFIYLKKIKRGFAIDVALSLLQGINYNQVDVNQFTLFTEQNGQYINAAYQLNMRRTDTLQTNNLYYVNGIGAGIDLKITIPIKKFGRISFGIKNFGTILFNHKTLKYAADTAFNYSGLQLNNLLSGSANFSVANQIDNLYANLYPKISNEKIWVSTPATIFIDWKNAGYGRQEWFAGIHYLYNTTAIPFAYLKYRYNFHHFWLMPQLAYGGFSTAHAGLAAGFRCCHQHLHFTLGSNDLEAFALYKSTAINAFLKIGYAFR